MVGTRRPRLAGMHIWSWNVSGSLITGWEISDVLYQASVMSRNCFPVAVECDTDYRSFLKCSRPRLVLPGPASFPQAPPCFLRPHLVLTASPPPPPFSVSRKIDSRHVRWMLSGCWVLGVVVLELNLGGWGWGCKHSLVCWCVCRLTRNSGDHHAGEFLLLGSVWGSLVFDVLNWVYI